MVKSKLKFLILCLFQGCWLQVANALTFQPLNSVAPAYYIPVTLTNSQGTSTAANLQVLININSNANSAIYASDLKNVNWQDGNGNILPSWLESGKNNTSSASSYWVNLGARTIAGGGGTLTIYQVIYATGTRAMEGTTTGSEPSYTATWGQYDSGSNVFTQYGGKSWSNFTTNGGAWNTTNGYLQQTSSGGTSLCGPSATIQGTSYPANGSYVIETAFNYSVQSTPRVGIAAMMSLSGSEYCGYRFIGQQVSRGAGFISFLNDRVVWVANSTYAGSAGTNYTLSIQNNAGTWSGTLYSGYGLNGTLLQTLTATAYSANNTSGASSGFVGVSATHFDGSNAIDNPANFQWFRLRVLPPSGVLPSTSAGSPVSLKAGFLFVPQ